MKKKNPQDERRVFAKETSCMRHPGAHCKGGNRNHHFQKDKNLKVKFLLKNTMGDCEHTGVSLSVKVPQLFTWRTLSPCTMGQRGTAPQVLT